MPLGLCTASVVSRRAGGRSAAATPRHDPRAASRGCTDRRDPRRRLARRARALLPPRAHGSEHPAVQGSGPPARQAHSGWVASLARDIGSGTVKVTAAAVVDLVTGEPSAVVGYGKPCGRGEFTQAVRYPQNQRFLREAVGEGFEPSGHDGRQRLSRPPHSRTGVPSSGMSSRPGIGHGPSAAERSSPSK
jgi:hypothetical protein